LRYEPNCSRHHLPTQGGLFKPGYLNLLISRQNKTEIFTAQALAG
jgi:hypothetical protein